MRESADCMFATAKKHRKSSADAQLTGATPRHFARLRWGHRGYGNALFIPQFDKQTTPHHMTMMTAITTTTTTTSALGTGLSLSSVWLAWMLCICALNGVAALACVAFVLHKNPDTTMTATAATETVHTAATTTTNNTINYTTTIPTTRMTRQNAYVIEDEKRSTDCVCGKRKTRESQPEFPLARKHRLELDDDVHDAPVTQGRCKLRRVTKITIVRFGARRSKSFGSELPTDVPTSPPSPLRRVVSCGDAASIRPFAFKPTQKATMTTTAASIVSAPFEEASATVSVLLREIRLYDVLSSAKAVVVAKLREAARNAVDEMLTSIISFATYGVLLFVVRQYSAVAVGVSLDLGAFSIEL